MTESLPSRNTKRITERIFNPHVSLRDRGFQVANAILTPFLCRPLRICHVVEFPKCGGSWIRNMIRTYLGSGLYLGDRLIFPDAVIHTHRLFRRSFAWPVVVVRDPRDMYVSMYHHENFYEGRATVAALERVYRHDPAKSPADDFAAYLEAKLTTVTHPVFFYSQFIDSWLGRPGSCLVRYEDFLEDAERELIRVIRFLDREVDVARIESVVQENSFESQTRKSYGESRSSGEEDRSKFLRKGVAGDWRNIFNEKSCNLIRRFEGVSMRRLGYEPDDSWAARFLDESSSQPSEAAPSSN